MPLRESKKLEHKVRIQPDSKKEFNGINQLYMANAINFSSSTQLRRKGGGVGATHVKIQSGARGNKNGKADPRRAVLPVMTDQDEIKPEMKLKDEKTKSVLLKSLQNSTSLAHLLFTDLELVDIEALVDEMFKVEIDPDQDVIVQGEVGYHFYFVQNGKFFLNHTDGDKTERIATKPPGSFFGELSLLYGQHSAFTVTASSDGGTLWAVSRHQFHQITTTSASRQQSQKLQYLQAVKLFQTVLELREIATLADAMEYQVFRKGDTILSPGIMLEKILFVGEGMMEMYLPGTKGKKQPVAKLYEGEAFGEMALVNEVEVEFELTAGSETLTVLSLDIAEFEGLLGSLKEYVAKRWAQAGSEINEERADTILQTLIQSPSSSIMTGAKQSAKMSEVEIAQTLQSAKASTSGPKGTVIMKDNQWDEAPPLLGKIQFDDLVPLKVLGQGSFGKVYLVKNKNYSQEDNRILDRADEFAPDHFALKIISREFIVENGWEEKADNEQLAMAEISYHDPSPFVLKMYHSWSCPKNIYLLIEVGHGGDLYELMMDQEYFSFSLEVTRFYLACVVSGISVFHKRSIVYRDLKPENLLIDSKGYIKLADLGLAKKTLRTYTVCGTPDYMAPEVLTGKGHDFACDWWATGVMTYEMLIGQTPFFGKTVNEIYERILEFSELEVTPDMELTEEAESIIKGLLQPKKTKRLGNLFDGVDGITSHPFFGPINWDDLYHGKITPPMMPDELLDFNAVRKDLFTRFTCFDDYDTPNDTSNWTPAVTTVLTKTPQWKPSI